MRKNIQQIASSFLKQLPLHQTTCSTDGNVVLSYAMPIAIRIETTNEIYVVDPVDSPSVTTSSQISGIVQALVFNNTPFKRASLANMKRLRHGLAMEPETVEEAPRKRLAPRRSKATNTQTPRFKRGT